MKKTNVLTCAMAFTLAIGSTSVWTHAAEAPAREAATTAKSGVQKGLPMYEFSQAEKDYKFAHMTFYETFEKWAQEDVGLEVGDDVVLAIGSSSFTGWRSMEKDLGFKVIRRGFGGSRMIDVLAYKDFFRRYKAKRIMIYEGDNDMGGSYKLDPAVFLEHCKTFVDYVREVSPDTEFYFVSIKPSRARMKKWPEMKQGNDLLKAYAAADKKITFIDVTTPMFNEEGTELREGLIRADGVHMSREGYEIWIREINNILPRDKNETDSKK